MPTNSKIVIPIAGCRRRFEILAYWIRVHQWRIGAELGVFRGDTYLYLLKNCPSLTLIGVDLWKAQPEMEKKRDSGGRSYAGANLAAYKAHVAARASVYGARSRIIVDYTALAARHILARALDFVFIDADHTYGGVSADIRAWLPKIKRGGAICGHDAAHPNFPGVSKALDELFGPDGWELFADHVWRVWIK